MRLFPVYYKGNDYWVSKCGWIYDYKSKIEITNSFSREEIAKIMATAWIGEMDAPIKFRNGDPNVLNRDNIQYEIVSKEIISDNEISINGVIFKRIPGLKYYFIADGGLVYSTFYDKLLHRKITRTLYLHMSMVDDDGVRKMFPLHRILYYVWNNKKPNPAMEINHIDGKEWHCYLWNLEEITPLENTRHAEFIINTREVLWTPDEVHFICRQIQNGKSIREIYDNNEWINKKIQLSGFKIFTHHLISHTKYWVDVSSQYDFSKWQNANIKYTDDQVHQICKMLCNKLKPSEISRQLNIDVKFISAIKCRKTRKDISSQYDF